jgi:hypothetical protein
MTIYEMTSSQVDLTWTENASDEDGFGIERSTDGLGVHLKTGQ